MRVLVQFVLFRIAAWLVWLGSRFGKTALAPEQSSALLAAAALQALDEAPRLPAVPTDDAAPLPGMLAEPPGYAPMTARAQLSPLFGNALLLVDEAGRLFLPIFVGATEALAFRTRLARQPFRRPLTHDLFDRLLEQIRARVIGVRVDELRDGVFYARLSVELADGRHLELDARPSDAIVLAVGAGAPIYVARTLLAAAGRRFDGAEPSPAVDTPTET